MWTLIGIAVILILEVLLMVDTSKLTAAVTDLAANVDKLAAADASAQPAVDAATSAVQAADAKVVALLSPAA